RRRSADSPQWRIRLAEVCESQAAFRFEVPRPRRPSARPGLQTGAPGLERNGLLSTAKFSSCAARRSWSKAPWFKARWPDARSRALPLVRAGIDDLPELEAVPDLLHLGRQPAIAAD